MQASRNESRVYLRYRESAGTECLGDSGEERALCLGSGVFFIEDCGLVSGPRRHPGTLEQRRGSRCYSLEPGLLARSCVAPAVWNAHLIASAGPSPLLLP